jgi:hypothetical protein
MFFFCFQALLLMARNAGFPARRPTAASPSRTTQCPRTQWPRTLASEDSNFWAPAAACAAKMGSGRPRVFPSAVSPLTLSFSPHLALCLCVSLSGSARSSSGASPNSAAKMCAVLRLRAVYRNCRHADQEAKLLKIEKKRPSLSPLLFVCTVCICRLDDWDGIRRHAVLARRRTNTRGNKQHVGHK